MTPQDENPDLPLSDSVLTPECHGLALGGLDVMPPPNPTSQRFVLELDGRGLTWECLTSVLRADELDVRLAPAARERMETSRVAALRRLADDSSLRVYGWNQALGPHKSHALDVEDQRQFQVNVLRSHAAGLGEYLSPAIARLALVLRANVLARGTTGARPELAERILEVVSSGIVPLMPSIGSLGTGDLQPMAAAGLGVIGEDVDVLAPDGSVGRAPQVLADAGLDPSFTMEAGEAIALISGSGALSACLVAAVDRLRRQTLTFIGAFALLCEAIRAEKQPFDLRLHVERAIPAEIEVDSIILAMLGDSDWMSPAGRLRLGESAPRIQDSTSVRSTPHVLASMWRTLHMAELDLTREANASTCNPMVLPSDDGDGVDFLMGGNWDCSLLGSSAHMLNVCAADLAVLAKDLTARLGNETWSFGLPANLSTGRVGLNSGMTVVHSLAASLVPEMHVRSMPVSSLSFPLKGGQEDHNSMAMAGVRNLVSNLDRLDIVIAVFLYMGAQGVDVITERMQGLHRGSGSTAVYDVIRENVQTVGEDRYMADDLRTLTDLVRSGRVSDVVEEFVPATDPASRVTPSW